MADPHDTFHAIATARAASARLWKRSRGNPARSPLIRDCSSSEAVARSPRRAIAPADGDVARVGWRILGAMQSSRRAPNTAECVAKRSSRLVPANDRCPSETIVMPAAVAQSKRQRSSTTVPLVVSHRVLAQGRRRGPVYAIAMTISNHTMPKHGEVRSLADARAHASRSQCASTGVRSLPLSRRSSP